MYFTVYFNKTLFLVCRINVYDYIKQNNMPTIRLRIKFSKTAFLNTFKICKKPCMFNPAVMDIPPVPNQSNTFKWPQRCFGKTNPVKRSFQASWFSNRTWLHYDEANDLAFCHICSVAYKDGKLNQHTIDKAFIINGFSNWKDVS